MQSRSSLVKVLASLGAALLVWLLLSKFGARQQAAGSVFTLAIGLWITEAFPLAITALLSTTLLVVTGALDEKAAMGAYGDPIILLFVGSFILARAMVQTGLEKRIAYTILSFKSATKNPSRILFTLGLISCLISLFVSNTAVTAMMLPIGVAILETMKLDKGNKTAIGLLLMLTWGSSVAVGVIVGTPPNLIVQKQLAETAGHSITFVEWMQFAMPINAVMLFICWLILKLLYLREPVQNSDFHERARQDLSALGPMRASEKNTLFAFFVALVLWMLPDASGMILGHNHPLAQTLTGRITPAVAAIFATILLFLLPASDRESGKAIEWREAVRIDWGTILMFAGGIALGKAMFDSGLGNSLGKLFASSTGVRDVWALTLLATAFSIFLSELASNTAAATTVVPIAISLAQGVGVSPIPPALGAAIGASFGFMLPISTAPNMIVYGSGLVPQKEMVKSGAILDVAAVFVIVACLRLILPAMGLS